MRLSGKGQKKAPEVKRCLGVRKKIRGSLQDVSGPRHRGKRLYSFSRPHCGAEKKLEVAAAENKMDQGGGGSKKEQPLFLGPLRG